MSSLVHYLSCPAVRRTAFILISALAVRLKALAALTTSLSEMDDGQLWISELTALAGR